MMMSYRNGCFPNGGAGSPDAVRIGAVALAYAASLKLHERGSSTNVCNAFISGLSLPGTIPAQSIHQVHFG